jgi:hypothetical protein
MTTNPLVSRIATGTAHRETLATLALEQHRVIPADRRAFLHLAQHETATPEASGFFEFLAAGEAMAGERLIAFAEACGVDETRLRTYDPLPGCQAYPAYVAWLALNAEPTDVVVALTSNFAEWGGYCATIAGALREHYGFTDAGLRLLRLLRRAVARAGREGGGSGARGPRERGTSAWIQPQAQPLRGDVLEHA